MVTRANSNPLRRLFWGGLLAVVLVGLSIAFVDRPASNWAHDTLRGIVVFPWLSWLVNPVLPVAMVGLSAAGLVLAGLAAGLGWRPKGWSKTLIACCLAAVFAFALKNALKYVFGRTWPESWIDNNPSWIKDGEFGFHFFHGGTGWGSFPSGHMTLITAPFAVLWQRARRWRWLCVLPILAVAIGLFDADYHFISDMIAGVYLGVVCASAAVALVG
ncbi:MAG TPA: phosphatase PAP2 family protein [Opitutaceae bacterium]|nr:phosphatase PAP2 family protein [Opitutaceae bacterium]